MKTLFQIHVVANSGSTGRIAEELGKLAIKNGWHSYIAYGRWACPSQSQLICIGNKWDKIIHFMMSFLFDCHGLASVRATRKLVTQIKQIKPDIIHLHNIHGYYLNYEILFAYLSQSNIPVVWTLHDCWSVTGHCVHFQNIGCNKWKIKCESCPNTASYPKSLFLDNASNNYKKKCKSFTSVKKMTIVPVCNWLGKIMEQSYLKEYNRRVIVNGIDLNVFYPCEAREKIDATWGIKGRFICLAVATVWSDTKGLSDIMTIRKKLSDQYVIIMVGVDKMQAKKLPFGIIGIEKTENANYLAELYSASDVYINPTYQDTLPTVNIEALACGTPVITYDTGGSADIIDSKTGYVVEQGRIDKFVTCISYIKKKGKDYFSLSCRRRAEQFFDKEKRYKDYILLYDEMIK